MVSEFLLIIFTSSKSSNSSYQVSPTISISPVFIKQRTTFSKPHLQAVAGSFPSFPPTLHESAPSCLQMHTLSSGFSSLHSLSRSLTTGSLLISMSFPLSFQLISAASGTAVCSLLEMVLPLFSGHLALLALFPPPGPTACLWLLSVLLISCQPVSICLKSCFLLMLCYLREM